MSRILECNEVCSFLENMGEDAIVGCDTEGTNIALDYRDGRGFGTGISLAFNFGEVMGGYYPYRHPSNNLSETEQYRLCNALRNFKGWLVFHNAKHDLVALGTLGVDYKGKFYDTMLLCHLLNETYPYAKSLNACTEHYLGEGKVKDDALVKICVAALNGQWHMVPAEVMAPYAYYDAVLTLELFEAIESKVFAEVPREYWDHKQKFIRTIVAMESRGIRIDVALCNRMAAVGETQMAETVEILDLNPGSSKDQYDLFVGQLGLPILRRSQKTDKPSFNKEVMEQYEEILEHRDSGDTTAGLVLTYRGWQKATSSNYKPYVSLLSPDGRLRPNYKLHGTKTGRMSCEKPNLQQIPRVSSKAWNGSVKAAFIPMEGYSLYEADYSQLEFRLGAAYGKDEHLLAIFANPDRDIFSEMAEVLNLPRQDCKTMTYTIQFGGGANRLSNVFGISHLYAQELKDNWFKEYPGIATVVKRATQRAKNKGKLQLWSGRYRHFMFPDKESHKAFNAVIQGGAADIMNGVMVRCFEEIDDEINCRMLLQVHDSIVWEIRTDLVDEYLPRIKKVMEDVRPDFGVQFRVDIHRWGEG